MFIFIRESEQSNMVLIGAGLVRRNHLFEFFIKRKNPKINIPEKIVTQNKETCSFQTVAMLGLDLNIKIDTYDNIDDVINYLIENQEKDILICWKYNELHKIIEGLIYALLKYNIKLHWDENPLSGNHKVHDYTSMMVLNGSFLYVFNQYDVFFNNKLQRYDIDYSKFKIQPLFSKHLSLNYMYRLINKLNIFYINRFLKLT